MCLRFQFCTPKDLYSSFSKKSQIRCTLLYSYMLREPLQDSAPARKDGILDAHWASSRFCASLYNSWNIRTQLTKVLGILIQFQ